jgi:hypothetical protein
LWLWLSCRIRLPFCGVPPFSYINFRSALPIICYNFIFN